MYTLFCTQNVLLIHAARTGFLGIVPELSFRFGLYDRIGDLPSGNGGPSSGFPRMDHNGTAQRLSRFLAANVYKIYI